MRLEARPNDYWSLAGLQPAEWIDEAQRCLPVATVEISREEMRVAPSLDYWASSGDEEGKESYKLSFFPRHPGSKRIRGICHGRPCLPGNNIRFPPRGSCQRDRHGHHASPTGKLHSTDLFFLGRGHSGSGFMLEPLLFFISHFDRRDSKKTARFLETAFL